MPRDDTERMIAYACGGLLLATVLGGLTKAVTSGRLFTGILKAVSSHHVPPIVPRLAWLALALLVAAVLLQVALRLARRLWTGHTLKTRETFVITAPPQFDPPADKVELFIQALQGLRQRSRIRAWFDMPACGFRVLFTVSDEGRPLYCVQVPRRFKAALVTALSEYRGVQLLPASDYIAADPGFNSAGNTELVRLELCAARSDTYPFRKTPEGEDPKQLIAGVLSDVMVDRGERLAIAFDFLLVPPPEQAKMRHDLVQQAEDQEESDSLLDLSWGDWSGKGGNRNGRNRASHNVERRMEQQALWSKVAGLDPFFRLQLLVCAQSPIPGRASMLVEKSWTALEQWTGQNYFRSVGWALFGSWSKRLTGSNSLMRRWWFDYRMTTGRIAVKRRLGWMEYLPHWLAPSRIAGIVAGHEFAAIFYTWSKWVHQEGVLRRERTEVAPPAAAPSKGLVICEAGGRTVALNPADSRYNGLYVGPTGSGKSTELENHVLDAIKQDHAVVFMDPAGDSVAHLLERIPEEYADRVQLLDPSVEGRAIGLNVLETMPGISQSLTADRVVAIFRRLFSQYWKDRSDDVMRNAVLTLMRQPGATLCDVPALLTDERLRQRWTRNLNDPIGLEPFWAEWEALGDGARAERAGPVLSRLRSILLRPEVRDILGQSRSTIDLSETLDNKRVLLVNLAEGTLGEDTSRLLGSLLVIRLWQAVLGRAARPEEDRPDALIIIDEFPNFVHLPQLFTEVVAKTRKNHVGWTLAIQFMEQLAKDAVLRSAVMVNCHTKLAWKPEDMEGARGLTSLMHPLAAEDLVALDAHQVAVRLCVDGFTQPLFTGYTLDKPPSLGADHAARLQAASLERWGRPTAEVEAEILERLRGPVPVGAQDALGFDDLA